MLTFSRVRFPSRAALKTAVLKSIMVQFDTQIYSQQTNFTLATALPFEYNHWKCTVSRNLMQPKLFISKHSDKAPRVIEQLQSDDTSGRADGRRSTYRAELSVKTYKSQCRYLLLLKTTKITTRLNRSHLLQ